MAVTALARPAKADPTLLRPVARFRRALPKDLETNNENLCVVSDDDDFFLNVL